MDSAGDIRKNLEAAELLLADVRNRRADLVRRERELEELVAEYRAKLSRDGRQLPPLSDLSREDEGEAQGEEYGTIGKTALGIFTAHGRKMSIKQVADALEKRQIPIRAKNYVSAARTVIRRLNAQKKLRRVGSGYYKAAQKTEAQG